MSKNKISVSVEGMHCKSCELLIEDKLSEIPEVERTVVNCKKGVAEIHYGSQKPNMKEVEKAIQEAGYCVGYGKKERKPWISKRSSDYKDLGIAMLFLVGIYVVLKNFGLTNASFATTDNPSGLGVVFLVGITAGLSTCMALVGGLVLGISARHSEKHPEATMAQKFRPHMFFNAGRVGGYAFLGGILGAIGSAMQFSSGVLGAVTIVVGISMLVLGMKLIGIFPRMEDGGVTLPKSLARLLGVKRHEREYSHRGAMITGALTFFLPCGFTQAMQLYAVSSGSFYQGALIMGVFALGTAPGLLGIGGLTSVVKGLFARRFFKFAGVIVIFLAFFNIANGYNLTGLQLGGIFVNDKSASNTAGDTNVSLENGVQVVRMKETSRGYSPSSFTIKKGVKVRWEIDAQDPYSCASSLVSSKLGVRKNLVAGKNVIEFTPEDSGKISFSCSMGMYTGSFIVVDNDGKKTVDTGSDDGNDVDDYASAGTCGAGGSGGCGGCGGSVDFDMKPNEGSVETGTTSDAKVQLIGTTYTYDDDIQPNIFTVKAGQPVKFVVDVKEDGYGCMSTIMIPGLYDDYKPLVKGDKIEMEFTPSKKGTYKITCAMGVPRGSITVE